VPKQSASASKGVPAVIENGSLAVQGRASKSPGTLQELTLRFFQKFKKNAVKACDIPHEQVVLNAYLQYYRGAQDIRSALIVMETEWLLNPTCKKTHAANEVDYDEDDAAEAEETKMDMILASQQYPDLAMAADGVWYSRQQLFAFYEDATIVKERFDISQRVLSEVFLLVGGERELQSHARGSSSSSNKQTNKRTNAHTWAPCAANIHS
jgi:hypothetical protein